MHNVRMAATDDSAVLNVAIIGAGFGGLAAAMALRKQGVRDGVVIFERADAIGGTWRDNTYPGCACDIPSHLYSLSDAPKNDWSRRYPGQAEILAYMREVVRTQALEPLIELGCALREARWDARSGTWTLKVLRHGQEHTRHARHLVSATGPLNKPAIPDIEGIEGFNGPRFHTMDWQHDVDLQGKRVAVVGTGASAIQVIPELVKTALAVGVFQRTPAWVIPRFDAPYGALRRWLHRRVPGFQRLNRWRIYWRNELFALNYIGFDAAQALALWGARQYLAHQIKDPALRQALTPGYLPGCKRIMVSDDYLPAMAHSKTTLITSAVTRCEGNTLVAADGQRFEADVLVYATGFRLTEFVKPLQIWGLDAELGALWANNPAVTWRGLMAPGFPNLYFMLGPNTGLGSSSVVFMIEAQAGAMSRIASRALQHKQTAQVTERGAQSFYRDVQAAMERTVWASGCASYYQSAGGRIDSLWPGFTWDYWLHMHRPSLGDLNYEAVPRGHSSSAVQPGD
jgi:cation diffusion facilitator CzcD-associated flavoprotein CzcO